MLKLFLKLLVLTMVILGIKTALWGYLKTCKPKHFNESGYKLDSMLTPVRSQINTVFVGSSRTAHSLNPAVFDSVTHHHTRSFNHGISAMFAPNTFAECEKLLRMDGLPLKTIFLELSFPPETAHEDPFSRDDPFSEIGFKKSHFFRESHSGKQWVQQGTTMLDSYLNQFFMLRSSVYMFVLSMLRNEQVNFIMTPTGYRYFRPDAFPNRQNNRVSEQMPPDTSNAPIQFTQKEHHYLNRLLALAQRCEEKKVAIYFFLPNRMMTEEKIILPNVYAALPARYRISLPYRPEFTAPFPANYSDDQQHLNQQAATQYTQLFAESFLQKIRTL